MNYKELDHFHGRIFPVFLITTCIIDIDLLGRKRGFMEEILFFYQSILVHVVRWYICENKERYGLINDRVL